MSESRSYLRTTILAVLFWLLFWAVLIFTQGAIKSHALAKQGIHVSWLDAMYMEVPVPHP